MTYKEQYEEGRRQHAKATPGRRRYDICNAINLTRVGIELERLERLGVSKKITARWRDRASHLLHDILDVSDPLVVKET